MSNNKQSSVELLMEKIATKDSDSFIAMSFYVAFKEEFEQAKAMHKEEHGKTWDDSLDNLKARGMNEMRAYTDFDEYYNETFGGNNDKEQNS